MTLSDVFGEIIIPGQWKYLGTNHTPSTDENGHTTLIVLGIVFFDPKRNIRIRISYILSTERYLLTEKDFKDKYKTRCDFRKELIENLNDWIKEEYK